MKKVLIVLTVAFVFLQLYAATPPKSSIINLPVLNGSEEVNAPVIYPPYPQFNSSNSTDEIGDTMRVGTTWYGNQHNGTVGRMIVKDDDGYIHVAWMNGLDYSATSRHIYYNFVSSSGVQGWLQTGVQVDNSQRAGFTTLDVYPGGLAIVNFHGTQQGQTNPITANACDILPRIGGFLTWDVPNQPPPGMVNQVIWPKMQIDHQDRIQFISEESTPAAGDPQRMVYSWGTYVPSSFSITYPTTNTWTYVDTTMTIAAEVATSEVSNRVAFAWTHPRGGEATRNQYNNDIYYLVDDDGVNPNFANALNLTNFIPPDLSFLPDTALAEMDTLRAYTDVGAFFDQDDYLHLVFTTPAYYELEGLISIASSLIWHWSEQYPQEFHLVANGWAGLAAAPGAWNRNAQRPCLGQNATTGNLYCVYQQFDQNPDRISQGGYPSGEIYISVSTDGGLSWSVGTNVTQTATPDNAPPGACLSEVTPSMAKTVDNYCHLLYVLDRDAGNILQTEGTWTLNQVYYHRVPITQIPVSPLMQNTIPFHVSQGVPPIPASIDLTPQGVIIIPQSGGSFTYNVALHNNQATPVTLDAWTMLRLPNGNWYGPVVGPINRTFPGGASPNRNLTQYIPPNAPAGTYTYEGLVGIYPNTIWDWDSFTFTKAGIGLANDDWAEQLTWSGDCFDEYATTADATLPNAFSLGQNYPNPFNPTTTISFAIPQAERVLLNVYDLQGRLVSTLVNGLRDAGAHQVTFDASKLASGIYLYKITAGSYSDSQKMVLLK
ncbi:MAG: T9SS type A sorting domain-containing protein [bacterium]|nr:T9SS type A sorting domain-containing protein [bacterium]